MLKQLQTLAAVAVIAFFGGFIAARYPMVCDSIAPSAALPEESDNSIDSSPQTALQPIKPIEPIASISSENVASNPSPAFSENAVRNESPLPLTKLAPVPSSIYDGTSPSNNYPAVKRLPPVCEPAPMTAGRYAAEYPRSPIPVYPSTGR